jgi:hypothetical protein
MRVSTTTLESFCLTMDPENESATEQELVATILGRWAGNANTERGYAFGQILEYPDKYRTPAGFTVPVSRDGLKKVTFETGWVEACLSCVSREGIFEVKAAKPYFDNIDVVAKVDQLEGRRVREFKNTTSTFDFDKYERSMQWRYYLDVFDLDVVTYQVFELSESSSGVLDLRNVHEFNLYAYPQLHADCESVLRDFQAYVRRRGLEHVLLERQRKGGS